MKKIQSQKQDQIQDQDQQQTQPRKLSLRKEILRTIAHERLRGVAGGACATCSNVPSSARITTTE